jgi:hypothetical protein
MEPLLVVGALVAAGYILASDKVDLKVEDRSKTLVDYYVQGSSFEDLETALTSGYRLIELHIYSDAQDEPIVSLKPNYDGIATRTFESCCTAILQKAFPSRDPLILSLVLHTDKSFTANRVAYHLNTTVRRQLFSGSIEDRTLDSLSERVVLVSGNEARGTDLEPLLNLSWNDSHLRRLSYQQAAHPREAEELRSFTHSHIAIVAPDQAFSKFKVMDDVYAYGCQWNLCATPLGRPGFIPRES